MSRFRGKTLNLREFLTRSEALKLYRDILRALRRVDSVSDRQQLTEWARSEYQQARHERDQESIQMHLTRGRAQLKSLEETLGRAR
ncbi:LYR motif-containing protein 2-like [Corticium candelabrum]|uniref:LYR motif-containing protein 2-like n=1 Tax=Corticium candelabrum TaxID=121492 RepID=UPI002E25EDA1|nr:LYR motif-containing protein 2-like [Corticium candelabrum]